MKKSIKQKKGISLIVLVITIVVMIILASAIILSSRSSSIIDRANEAKRKSDIANAKEVVSLAYSEWELNQASLKGTYSTFSEYATAKLSESGFDTESMYITEEGDVFFNVMVGMINTIAKEVPIGAKIEGYKLTQKSDYKTDGKERSGLVLDDNTWEDKTITGEAQNLKMNTEVSWKYMGMDENGNALIVADINAYLPKIQLAHQGGVVYGIDLLDTICNTFYSTEKGNARNMNIGDVNNILNYTGPLVCYYPFGESELTSGTEFDNSDYSSYLENVFDVDASRFGKFNYYPISSDSENIECNNEELKIVFQNNAYFLASYTLVNDPYDYTYPNWGVRVIANDLVSNGNLAFTNLSNWYTGSVTSSIRPVVTLNSSQQAIYDTSTNTLTLM